MAGLRIAMPATCSTVTVFSLSVNAYVGHPPRRRKVTSMQAITVGSVLSKMGSTTRNRHHASQAQNSVVLRPAIVGPSPKSYWSHKPGSGTHGRYTRRLPAVHDTLTDATARRHVRSEPL